MLCQFQVYSKVIQLYIYIHIYILFQVLFPCSLLQVTEYSFQDFIYLFIYLFVCLVLAALGLPCCTSFLQLLQAGAALHCSAQASHCGGFSLRSTGSRRTGFSSCGTRAQQLWCMGLVVPGHVGSSRTRARTCVPCIGRWILNHCATREAPQDFIFFNRLYLLEQSQVHCKTEQEVQVVSIYSLYPAPHDQPPPLSTWH